MNPIEIEEVLRSDRLVFFTITHQDLIGAAWRKRYGKGRGKNWVSKNGWEFYSCGCEDPGVSWFFKRFYLRGSKEHRETSVLNCPYRSWNSLSKAVREFNSSQNQPTLEEEFFERQTK